MRAAPFRLGNDEFHSSFNLGSAGTAHKLIKIIVLFPFPNTIKMVSHERNKRCQTFDEEPWKALIPPLKQWKSVKQVFNLHSVTIQHNFCTFVAVLHIFIWRNLSPTNRDGLSHAWLFKLSRVNVINVHDYNAELQLSVLICGAVPLVWDSILCQAWDPPAVWLKSPTIGFHSNRFLFLPSTFYELI